MRKDESGVAGWCKHTSNEIGGGPRGGRRYVNKRVRLNVKRNVRNQLKEMQDGR
jgi:hypothetical protein